MLTLVLLSAALNAAPLNVLVDPGHGGRDHGTTRGETFESQITLSVSKRLRDLLAADRRFRVSLTREDDATLPLPERARLAREKKADLFVSIHVNSNPEKHARGAEFYFQNQLPPDEESMYLAHRENEIDAGQAAAAPTAAFARTYPTEVAGILQDLLDGDRILRSSQLTKALKTSWRGNRKSKSNSVRQAPFFVLANMPAPSALVELGFLTNEEDFRDLTNPAVQARMAEDLYRGLLQYKESITNGHASR